MKTSIAAPVERAGQWMADSGYGVYVHIPFCRHRCHYCDFNTYAGLDALFDPYVDALVRSVDATDEPVRVATSVFFGGGTPTLLAPAALGRVLDAIRGRMGIAPDAEITVEANPETVDEAAFESLLRQGFNRFSIGVQSLAPHVLAGLGRTHSAERALEAVGAARRAGVLDLNLDLIFGSPWEGERDWVDTLARVIDAAPDHVSAYSLIVEEGTPLHTLVATGRVKDVDPDVQADRYLVADELLGAAGYERYEVSNWCRPGRASRHNLLYWSAGDYLGVGAGAHGHHAGRRYWCLRLPRDFIAAARRGAPMIAGGEELDLDRRGGEALMLGLRLASGIHTESFVDRFGRAVLDRRRDALDELSGLGLLERDDGWIRIPRTSTLVTNEALCRLL